MPAELPTPDVLARMLGPLLSRGKASLIELGLDELQLRVMGFDVADGMAFIPATTERLRERLIRQALSERGRSWVRRLDIHEVVGSTSTMLNELISTQSINGLVKMAELQVQGRGRRGRRWMSPYGTNLSISLGTWVPQTPDQLGGFSLCIGLAIVDHLQAIGIDALELKWPNDVLVRGRKIAGILIELHSMDAGTEIVVGVGVNLKLPAEARMAIEQPVTDLHETGVSTSRNLVAGGLISSIIDFVDGFAEHGFAPMRDLFDRHHRFQGKQCQMLCGSESVVGRVKGVTERGELLLEIEGKIRSFSAGEVSLRESVG